MKYNKDTINIILHVLSEGEGRVRAVEEAGIDYQTFTNWFNGDVPKSVENKSEFSDLVKKAELAGNDFTKHYAINCIKAKMESSWQAAAWWLERNYPSEFALKSREEAERHIDTAQLADLIDKGDGRDEETNKETKQCKVE